MRCFGDFLSDQRGSATVEVVIRVPWFMALLTITADVSLIHLGRTRVLHASRDAPRRLSTGDWEPADLTGQPRGRLGNGDYRMEDCSTTSDACVRIARLFVDTAVFGRFLGDLVGEDLVAQTVMRKEPGA
jgi:hypothetical protein